MTDIMPRGGPGRVAALIRNAKTASAIRGAEKYNVEDVVNLSLKLDRDDADFLLRYIGGSDV